MVDLHDRSKQVYWDTPGAKTARNLIGSIMKKAGCTERQACKLIGSRIDLNHKYFYQIAGGYKNPGQVAMKKIEAYYYRYNNRPAYKKRLVVSFDNDELVLFEKLRQMDNEQRKQALKNHYVRLYLRDEL